MDEETFVPVEENPDAAGVPRDRDPDSTPVRDVGMASSKGSSRSTKILIGCGIALLGLACAIGLCVSAAYFLSTTQDSATLGVEADYPDTVQAGDQFELTIYLQNQGEENLDVEFVTLSDAYASEYDSILAGATLISTEPKMASDQAFSIGNAQMYFYNRVLGPGETHKVVFEFRAVESGEYHTDVFIDLGNALSDLPDLVISITP